LRARRQDHSSDLQTGDTPPTDGLEETPDRAEAVVPKLSMRRAS
jgi:hypothetical protein